MKQTLKISAFSSTKEIIDKVKSGEIDLSYNKQHHEKHLLDTKLYNDYLGARKSKGLGRQSRLTIDFDHAQELVSRFAGKGIVTHPKRGFPGNRKMLILRSDRLLLIWR